MSATRKENENVSTVDISTQDNNLSVGSQASAGYVGYVDASQDTAASARFFAQKAKADVIAMHRPPVGGVPEGKKEKENNPPRSTQVGFSKIK